MKHTKLFFHTTEIRVDKPLYFNETNSSPKCWHDAISKFIVRYKRPETRKQLSECIALIQKAIDNNVQSITITSRLLNNNSTMIYITASFMFKVDYESYVDS